MGNQLYLLAAILFQQINFDLFGSIIFGLSARLSVHGHSNSVIFNQISFKFIYGLLPSNSSSSLNTGFVRRTITKMADKMAATYVFAVVVTLTQSFLIRFLPNFIYELLPSNSYSSLNTGYIGRTTTKMADRFATAYPFSLVKAVMVTLTQSFLIRFLSN